MRGSQALPLVALSLTALACQATTSPLFFIGCTAAVVFVVLPAAVLHRALMLYLWGYYFPTAAPSLEREQAERLLFRYTLALALISALVWSRVGLFSLQGMLLLDAVIGITLSVWLTRQVAQDYNAESEATLHASIGAGLVTGLILLALGISCWTAVPVLAAGVFVVAHYANTHYSLEAADPSDESE